MPPERYEQIAEIYRSALEFGPKQRVVFRAQACAGGSRRLTTSATIVLFIKVDARLNPRRSEPRFLQLVQRIDEACQ